MKKCRYFIILPLVSFFLCSCENNSVQISLSEKIAALFSSLTENTGNADKAPADVFTTWKPSATAHLDQNDKELSRIAENARRTLPEFYRHLLRPAAGQSGFRVKYPFRADAGSGFSMEQLWLEDIHFKDGVYYGIIANTPFYTAAIKKGDTVSFSAGDITDWMYIENGKITGGHSIKYLLEQLAEHERNDEQRAILQMFE